MRLISLVIFFMQSLGYAQEDVVHIKISPIVEVSSKQIYYLSDIAQGSQAEELDQIRIPWKIPQVVTRDEIYSSLKKILSQTGRTYSLDIPPRAEFIVSENKISEKEIERKIRNQLESLCSECRFHIKLSKLPRVDFPDWKVDFSSLKEKGSFALPLTVPGAWISGTVRTEKPVLVLKKPLRREERLTKDHVKKDYREITFLADALVSEEEILEMKARRDMAHGAVLQFQNLVREADAQKGSTLKVITGNSLFEITTQGIAEAQGQIGEIIPLRLLDSKKVITGEIIEKGVVKIQ
jgi:flagella basal body P-ring formation protein FlgA